MAVEDIQNGKESSSRSSLTPSISRTAPETSSTRTQNGEEKNGSRGVSTKPSSNGASNHESTHKNNVAPRAPNKVLNALGYLLRTVIIDVPLMLLFASYLSTILLEETLITYLIPQVELMKWSKKRQQEEVTYFHRLCRPEDITTNATEDLMISEKMDATDCMEHMLRHGVSLYPDILSEETAKAARDFILERNLVEEGFGVIENKNRWSFGVQVNSDPSIQQALKEIGEHEQLQAALRKIAGPNPAIVEFTAITSAFGATTQYFHQDVVPDGSAFKWARSFVPTYSLFIPLQGITAEMGPTEICPGSHQCSGDIQHQCEERAMLVSGQAGTWKTGTGALLNQQLFHRGTAHVDRSGPARTLFILTFAGRPRYNKNQVETRMIGHQGSYSLRWNQWGHTMDDFANAAKQMAEPWVTLRSLGLLKAPGRDWGWDYITVACMRMANGDSGFGDGTLATFVNKGGFTLLPKFLKAERKRGDDWPAYLLRSIAKIREWLHEKNVVALAGYVAGVLLLNLSMWYLGIKRRGRVVRRAMGRLILTYGLVLVIGFLGGRRISTSQWAQNIRHGKSFRGYRSPIITAQPATLPLDVDVVKHGRYQTSYLASSTQVLDITHPGNHHWIILVNMNAWNYHNLPLSLQRTVAKMVLNEVKTFHWARMLKQHDDSGKWVEMSEREELQKAHEDLLKASNEELKFVLTQLDYLEGELGGGVFRESRLHRKEIPALLSTLRKKLIGMLYDDPHHAPAHLRPISLNKNVTTISAFKIMFNLTLPTRKVKDVTRSQRVSRSSLPPSRLAKEPFPGAWIHEGDTVIGKFNCDANEWYRAIVTSVDASDGAFDIRYDDGREDKGLYEYCIRPFFPYELYEPMGVFVSGTWYNGRIVGVHDNNLMYDVETYTIGVQTNVSAIHLRRFDYDFGEGTVVEVKNQAGDKWRRGEVVDLQEDNEAVVDTIDIRYEDGEEELGVAISRFRLIDPKNERGGNNDPSVPSPSETEDVGSDVPLCVDQEAHCGDWASRGECSANPSFMHSKCAKSCGACELNNKKEGVIQTGVASSATGTAKYELTDEDKKVIRMSADFGEEQAVAGSESAKTLEVLRASIAYMTQDVPSLAPHIQAKCVNREVLCAFWAAIGECKSNQAFMLDHCSPSCKTCVDHDELRAN